MKTPISHALPLMNSLSSRTASDDICLNVMPEKIELPAGVDVLRMTSALSKNLPLLRGFTKLMRRCSPAWNSATHSNADVIPYLLKAVVAEQDDTCRELIGLDCFVRVLIMMRKTGFLP